MSRARLLVTGSVVAVLAMVGCTKRNPAVCCITEADCADFGFPYPTPCEDGLACDGTSCVEPLCGRPSDCIDPTLPYCVDGICLACDSQGDLGCLAEAPVCDSVLGTCGPCTGPEDCTTHAGTPLCIGGACVACSSDADCEAAAPICDGGDCRGCQADDECTSGACDRDTGECIASDNVIYVMPSGTDAGTCTMVSPCESPRFAMQQLSTTRAHIVIAPGEYQLASSLLSYATITADQQVTIHGAGAMLNADMRLFSDETAVFLVDGGALTVIGLSIRQLTPTPISNGFWCRDSGRLMLLDVKLDVTYDSVQSDGCEARIAQTTLSSIREDLQLTESLVTNGGTLELTRSRVEAGILDIVATDFVMENNLILSGIVLQSAHGAASFNTIANTYLGEGQPRAVLCSGAPPAPEFVHNILWVRGATTALVGGTCDVHDSIAGPIQVSGRGNVAVDPEFVDDLGQNFHLTESSPAIDVATSGPIVDFEGDSRPRGQAWDLGYDEAK